MNCEKCGALLDESGSCPSCDSVAYTVANNRVQNYSNPKKKHPGQAILAIILALIIALGGCTCALVYFEAAYIPGLSLLLNKNAENYSNDDTVSEPFASNAETLAWKSRTDEVNVRQAVWINFFSIFKIHLLRFNIVNCIICLIGVFIYFAMPDAFKTADCFKSASETADPCEHIKKSDCHKASDRSFYLFNFPFHRPFYNCCSCSDCF